METKWLEDFITLAQTRNFSKAANLRCVTQPAFSRRIQSLEAWLGCELIDRGAYPTRLTAQGDVFYEQALEVLERIRETRSMLRGGATHTKQQVRLVVPHTLAYGKAPFWLKSLKQSMATVWPGMSFQLTAKNVHDAVLHFTDGGCDFLVCFHHSREPIELDSAKYEFKSLGTDTLRPYSKADEAGKPLYNLDPLAPLPVPVLDYSRHAYLSKMVDIALENGPRFLKDVLFETDMSESLKAVCEAGLGVAWLADAAVNTDITPVLVPVESPYKVEMDIRLYRRVPKSKDSAKHLEMLELIWNHWPD